MPDAADKNVLARVRMYRQGLGDCFLLTFPRPGGASFYMLIDCGVVLGTKDPEPKMRRVVRDIARTTKTLDVVVATHEHWDHLSGFLQAADEFKNNGLKIKHLWLAWTEDPSNKLARKLRAEMAAKKNALHLALGTLGDARAPLAGGVQSLLEFFGPNLGAAGKQSTGEALKRLRGFVKFKPRFCYPKEPPIELDALQGVRFYVLGPPEDEKLIKKSDPTKKGKEVYEPLRDPSAAFLEAVVRGARGAGDSPMASPEVYQWGQPFNPPYRMTRSAARNKDFYRHHYFRGGKWRQIETDWLDAAGQLALQLDSDTNNTSLALAIELPGGQVLLFPADAQVGNWLSWDKQRWKVKENGVERTVTAAELLARTVLYKVGHHGSHNATLREKGLERMTSPDLMAMMPVDEKVAHDVKNWKHMPFAPLVKALKEKTKGRLLRIDRGLQSQKPQGISSAEWNAFKKRVSQDPDRNLYFEFAIMKQTG